MSAYSVIDCFFFLLFCFVFFLFCLFFFQAEDGIRDLVRSRGLGDVYKRQLLSSLSGLEERYRNRCNLKLLILARQLLSALEAGVE